MCLLLRKPVVFRLALGIIIVFILCLPDFFKIHEANTVMVSCIDTCSSSNTTFPLCTFNNSYTRSVQQRRENQTILLKVIVNNSSFQNIPYICQLSWREPQSHPKQTECESKRDVSVAYQGSGLITKKAKGSLEVKTENVTYFHKYFNFTMVSKKEVEHNVNYLMEIHINKSIVRGRNAVNEQLNHSCLLAMMEDQNDCINISLQLKSHMESTDSHISCDKTWEYNFPFPDNGKTHCLGDPMCMAKITWLTMIPVVFVFTVSIVIYKIVQENKQNHHKHRVATSVSTVLRRKGSRHTRRNVSATKIHPFPVKTSKPQIPLPAQTTKILPVIPEQVQCHVDQL